MIKFFRQKPLVFSFFLIFAMTSVDVPLFMGAFSFFVFLWKWAAEEKNFRLFPRRLTAFLSLVLPLLVYLQYRTLISQEASSTLLLGLSSLKIMDYKNDRDHLFLILLGFIMVALKPIFSLDLYWFFPSLMAFTGLWFSLLPSGLFKPSRFLIKLFLFSTPLTAILFFAFPRIVVPWAMSRSSGLPAVGFSDQLNPGGVAELASTPTTAFRVKFHDSFVSQENLYWRGSVLSVAEGLRWIPGRQHILKTNIPSRDKKNAYEVILEPGSKGYLFVLSYPTQVDSLDAPLIQYEHQVFRTTDFTNKTLSYDAAFNDSLYDRQQPDKIFLQLPPLSPRIQSWISDIAKKNPTPAGRLEALQKFFSDPSFAYTLKPGTYGKNGLEEFLFQRRRGFCEHFAGAYATLARALGIPSRVVVGYQGGSYNPYGDFWKISQRDAHAWVEIYLDEKWQRRDPTDWVAPLRLSLGAEEFFSLPEEDQISMARALRWRPPTSHLSWWKDITYWVDDLNYRWNYVLMDFDRTSQENLWNRLSTHFKWVFPLAFLFSISIFLLALRFLRVGKDKSDWEILFALIFSWGKSIGRARSESEPPLSYLSQLGELRPEANALLKKISENYENDIYQNRRSFIGCRQLLREWRKFAKRLNT